MIDGKKVKAYCALKGISQKQLAESIGLNPNTLTAIIRRGNTLSVNLENMANALGCKMDDLVTKTQTT